jgi:hypothetical protein
MIVSPSRSSMIGSPDSAGWSRAVARPVTGADRADRVVGGRGCAEWVVFMPTHGPTERVFQHLLPGRHPTGTQPDGKPQVTGVGLRQVRETQLASTATQLSALGEPN